MERLNVSFVSSISLPPTLTNPFPLSKMDNGTDSGQELPSKLVPILQWSLCDVSFLLIVTQLPFWGNVQCHDAVNKVHYNPGKNHWQRRQWMHGVHLWWKSYSPFQEMVDAKCPRNADAMTKLGLLEAKTTFYATLATGIGRHQPTARELTRVAVPHGGRAEGPLEQGKSSWLVGKSAQKIYIDSESSKGTLVAVVDGGGTSTTTVSRSDDVTMK